VVVYAKTLIQEKLRNFKHSFLLECSVFCFRSRN